MKDLMLKELKLAMHPTAPMFLALSAMLLIPAYPYYVIFFYTSLALFFICLSGRENQDVFYTMLLPVSKRDIVKARMLTAVTLQIIQVLVSLPFMFIRGSMADPTNAAGMDANASLIGLSFAMLGIFNMTFFGSYYKDIKKVGTSFMVSSIITFVYILIAEACAHAVPFVKNHLDTCDSENLPYRLAVLAAGAAVYIVLTVLAYWISAERFEKQDL